MKKLLSSIFLCIVSAIYISAWATTLNVSDGQMNPFAYDLWSQYDKENNILDLGFKTNATTQTIRVIAVDSKQNEYILVEVLQPAEKNTFEYQLSLNDILPLGEVYKWRVDVEGIVHTDVHFVTNENKLYRPTSIDVDDNPENDNFGMVFCTEALHNGASTTGYISSINDNGAGLYVFNADGMKRELPRKTQDKNYGVDVERYGWNGGRSLANLPNFADGKPAFAPYRVRVSDDGRIFISCLRNDGEVLYEANKRSFNPQSQQDWDSRYWTRVLSVKDANNNTRSGFTISEANILNGGQFVAGPNMGFDVQGSGKDLKLLMLSGNQSAIESVVTSGFRCDEYHLGHKTVWEQGPSNTIFSGSSSKVLNYQGAQVLYDKNGDVWMAQYQQSVGSYPTLLKYNKNGTLVNDANIPSLQPYRRCGAIRFNRDFSKVIITAQGSANNAVGGSAMLYPVLEDGMPDWANGQEINMVDKTGYSHMDYAWDYADNLYIACDADNSRCIAIYAMPKTEDDKVVSTPAASRYSFSTGYTVTWWNLYLRNQDVSTSVPSNAYYTPDNSKYNYDYTDVNNRLWRLIQVGFNEYRYSKGFQYAQKRAQIDDAIVNGKPELQVSDYFNVDDVDVAEFFSTYPMFSWLGEYLTSVTGTILDSKDTYSAQAHDFINRKGAFEEMGKPEYWRPYFTEGLYNLKKNMGPEEYMPVIAQMNMTTEKQRYFDSIWIGGWNIHYYSEAEITDLDSRGLWDWKYVSCPSQWYKFNSVTNRNLILEQNIPTNSRILAWRDGSADGDIVHHVTRHNMQLYATYVQKKIEEDNPPANPANDDATNEDLFLLLNNKNFLPGNPTAFPTHDHLAVVRKLQAGMYNTICLPLSHRGVEYLDLTNLTADHPLAYDNGNGAMVLEFVGVTSGQEGSGYECSLLNFERVTQMYAGKPYLVKLREGSADWTDDMIFDGVSAHNDLHPVEIEHNGVAISFVPTINPITPPEGALILVSNNRLAQVKDSQETMKGMRGYFTIAATSDPEQAQRIAEQAAAGRVYISIKHPVSTSVVIAPEAEQQIVPKVQKIIHNDQIYIQRGDEVYTLSGLRVR